MSQVRIATHPDYQGMGYGSRALDLLEKYYEGQITSLDESAKSESRGDVNVVTEEVEFSPRQTSCTSVVVVQVIVLRVCSGSECGIAWFNLLPAQLFFTLVWQKIFDRCLARHFRIDPIVTALVFDARDCRMPGPDVCIWVCGFLSFLEFCCLIFDRGESDERLSLRAWSTAVTFLCETVEDQLYIRTGKVDGKAW